MGLLLLALFLSLMFLGVPIALAIGIPAIPIFLIEELPLAAIPQTLFSGVNAFALVAVPFFVLAGDILARGGISGKIVAFADAVFSGIRGGLLIVATVASIFIAAISGSGAATTAAVGSSLLPDIKKKGYDLDFSVALVAAAGTIGVVIPPSVPMVLFAVIASVSVRDLFLGGFIPGLLMGTVLIAYSLFVAKKRNYDMTEKVPFAVKMRLFRNAIWGLMTPILILGGIFSGVFTPSEAAAVAVAYSAFVAMFIYKSIDGKKLYELTVNAGVTSGLIMFIISTAKLFGWTLTYYEIPEKIATALLHFAGNSWSIVYLTILVIILLAGMFMETSSALIILAPIFIPVIERFGGNLIHFGLVMTVGLAIGMATPPVAINIYVASAITGLSIGQISRPILPMVFALILTVLVITFVPQLVLFLPNLLAVGG